MSTTVVSSFGTLTEDQVKILEKGVREMSDIFTMQEAQRDALKEVLNHVYDEIKIPKKIIRKVAKTYHRRNFSEVVIENEEFEALYEGVIKSDS